MLGSNALIVFANFFSLPFDVFLSLLIHVPHQMTIIGKNNASLGYQTTGSSFQMRSLLISVRDLSSGSPETIGTEVIVS